MKQKYYEFNKLIIRSGPDSCTIEYSHDKDLT